MKAYDFEYNGRSLSEFGFIICNFGSKGIETVGIPNITFNTVSTMNGEKHELTSSEYGDCLTTTFQICKNLCSAENEEISIDELREIIRWLNRKEFHKFKILNEDYLLFYFEATFNVSKIEMDGKLFGLELEVITNRPHALYEPVSITIKNLQNNGTKRIASMSDEEGYIYPEMEIFIDEDGDFELYNSLEERTMYIANCQAGEVIRVHYPIIESSLSEHKIQNDFNWKFFRIANTFENNANDVTISIPCTIKIKYSPIVKVGI